MSENKVSANDLLQYSVAHYKVLQKYNQLGMELDKFLYPFVSPRELKVIAKVLTKIKKHKETKEETNE